MHISYYIDPSNISTDVESTHAGEVLGMNRFLHFMQKVYVESQEFETFGDSEVKKIL